MFEFFFFKKASFQKKFMKYLFISVLGKICEYDHWEDLHEVGKQRRQGLLTTQDVFQSEVRRRYLGQNHLGCFLKLQLPWHCPKQCIRRSRQLYFKWASQILQDSKAWELLFIFFAFTWFFSFNIHPLFSFWAFPLRLGPWASPCSFVIPAPCIFP